MREGSMATHSRILARRIPRTEEPGGGRGAAGGLQSTGSQRVRHDLVTNTCTFHLVTEGCQSGKR